MLTRYRCLLSAPAAVWLLTAMAPHADARPEYARKEGVACQYCHLSGSPGSPDQLTGRRQSTERNNRGIYYGTHNHTFQGFVEADAKPKVAAPTFHLVSKPTFHFVWKEEIRALPRRIAVADVKGDGVLRLIALTEKPGDKSSATLEVQRWDGKAFVTEFTGDVHAAADRLAVGRMGGRDRPAVILTSDALWAWDGTTYARHPAATPMPLLGVTRMADGTERVLLAPTSRNVLAYRVNLTSVRKDDWLVDPIAAPSPPQDVWGDMHTTPEFFSAMGIPDVLGAGGILGIWNIKKYNSYFIYNMKLTRDFDIAADPQNPGKPKITDKNPMYFVTLRDTRAGIELWSSPRLPGTGYDIVLDDPKGSGKPGFLILFDGIANSAGGAPAKGRTLAFFAMD